MKYPDNLITVNLPSELSPLALDVVKEMFFGEISFFPDLSSPEWLLNKDAKGVKWQTRFKKLLYQYAGLKINPATLSRIGEVIDRYTIKGESLHFCFAPYMVPQEFDISWGRNDGTGRSCWRDFDHFGSIKLCDAFFRSGGKVMRFYKSPKAWRDNPWMGIGRTFCIQQDEHMIVFNAMNPSINSAKAISLLFGGEIGLVRLNTNAPFSTQSQWFARKAHIVGPLPLPERIQLRLKW